MEIGNHTLFIQSKHTFLILFPRNVLAFTFNRHHHQRNVTHLIFSTRSRDGTFHNFSFGTTERTVCPQLLNGFLCIRSNVEMRQSKRLTCTLSVIESCEKTRYSQVYVGLQLVIFQFCYRKVCIVLR